jgi:hypothetical protein
MYFEINYVTFFFTDIGILYLFLFLHKYIWLNIFNCLVDLSMSYVLTNILIGRFLVYHYVRKFIETLEYRPNRLLDCLVVKCVLQVIYTRYLNY